MINLTTRALFSRNASISERIGVMSSQNWYLLEDCRDFKDNFDQICYPKYKRLFFPSRAHRNLAYVIIRNQGITIHERNPFVAEVKLHDESGEIDLFWMDGAGYEKARAV